jgi:NTP pyrophosphatase (non-canonical NTP hydrolase)
MLDRIFNTVDKLFKEVDEVFSVLDGPAGTPVKSSFQQRASNWIHTCFGKPIATDITERNFRFLEEALELVQASGFTIEQVSRLVTYTYNRPVGQLYQEVGGVMITLAALCSAHGINMEKAGETDLKNAIEKTEKIRVKWGTKPDYIRGKDLVVEQRPPNPPENREFRK